MYPMAMHDIPDDVSPETPTHRSRPSLITNASGWGSTISYGTVGSSIMSADGFARLSQFPPPPSTFPPIPFSPVEDMSASPSSSRRALPTPPSSYAAPIAPLNIQKRTADQAVPSVAQVLSSQADPLSAVPPTAASSTYTYPSPYDWHDGSSSIAADPYGQASLPTHFITSLISSVMEKTDASTDQTAPPRYKYSPSVASTSMTVDSTITYPPPQTHVPPVPPLPPRYSIVTSSPSSPQDSSPSVDIAGSSSPLDTRPPVIPNLGRRSPETVQTYTSVDQRSSASAQDTTTSRSMTASPSIQSLNSMTPLMRAFPREEAIAEEDEAGRSLGASTPGKSSRENRHRRSSTAYSSRTTRSYMSSLAARVSHSSNGERRSLKQIASNLPFRRKPLPPVPPLPHIPVQDIMRAENALPLPDLVNRAQALSRLLDNGHRPHHSLQSLGEPKPHYGIPFNQGEEEVIYDGTNPNLNPVRRKGHADVTDDAQPDTPTKRRGLAFSALSRRQRLWICIILGVVVVGIIVGVAVGVTTSKKSSHKCPDNFTGTLCNLDATCVCTTTENGQCNGLARSVYNIVADVNRIYGTNFTTDSVATSVWEAQGASPGSNCAAQANLIDAAPLNSLTSPNRTLWAQTALLWNLVLSEDTGASSTMQSFIQNAPWSSLSTSDGLAANVDGKFSTQVSGFQFDFAGQTVTEPAATFKGTGQPTQAQLDAVDDVAGAALDRMYTYALASSTQQQKALSRYWTSVLQQKASDLSTFVSNLRASPVLLPFDSTLSPGNQPVADLLTNSTTTPFPPPLGCYPGLDSTKLDLLNSVETTVFGLSPASAVTSFDTSCYPDRPIYGVLDVLRLRLPFANTNTSNGMAQQAAVVIDDVSSRVVVYNGELLSTFPGANSTGSVVTDPRQYGTLNNLNHVLLQYLTSIPDRSVAVALVEYVLTQPAIPPSNTSALFAAIPTLPTLEVAVFGSVTPSDVEYAVSSLSAPDGTLYFGTTASSNLRDWAITGAGREVKWTQFANDSQIVHDTAISGSSAAFDDTWNSAFNFFHTVNNATVLVSNITEVFEANGLFAPF